MLNKETNETNFDHYISELEFDLASQHKSIDVLKKIQAIGTDFGLEINCDLVVSVIEYICRISSEGTILVFLPGWNEIVKCSHLLRQRTLLASYLHILPLHSLLPLHNQQEIFDPPSHPNIRKVILSTSIAETSITIDDVVYVIDTGRTKASDYDLETQGKCLLPSYISRANLLQRKGWFVLIEKS
jgi:ATP-dependent RNA helicase DHX36